MKRLILVFALVALLFSGVAGGDIFESDPVVYNVTYENGSFAIDGEGQKDIAVARGFTYQFNVNTSGHSFYIGETEDWGESYDGIWVNGVTTTNATDQRPATDTGVMTFKVPEDAPDQLYYMSADDEFAGGHIIVNEAQAPGTDDYPLPVFFGLAAGIPFWMIGLFTVLVGVVGYLVGRQSDEIEYL